MTTAKAHPNIALIKYWGKQTKTGNLPATPNLSITLDTLATTTHIKDARDAADSADATMDSFILNGEPRNDPKLTAWLGVLRQHFKIQPLHIESENNFPTGAGLASSASGFAALMTAINHHADLGLNPEVLSDWARQGSASAARSIFGGYVALLPPAWVAQPLAPAEHFPLHVAIAITSTGTKSVDSSTGMERSRLTSPFYKTWVHDAADDYASAQDAITSRDFEQLATAAELNCLKMHSVMLTSTPTLAYWQPATLACIHAIQEMRQNGVAVFFTIDAGPQIKAVCLPDAMESVCDRLAQIDGVLKVVRCGMGGGAQILP